MLDVFIVWTSCLPDDEVFDDSIKVPLKLVHSGGLSLPLEELEFSSGQLVCVEFLGADNNWVLNFSFQE